MFVHISLIFLIILEGTYIIRVFILPHLCLQYLFVGVCIFLLLAHESITKEQINGLFFCHLFIFVEMFYGYRRKAVEFLILTGSKYEQNVLNICYT